MARTANKSIVENVNDVTEEMNENEVKNTEKSVNLEPLEDSDEIEVVLNVGYITELTIPKFVDYIRDRGIAHNSYLQTLICLNPEPPTLEGNPFEGLYMDKVVLQVPEQSVQRIFNVLFLYHIVGPDFKITQR